MRDNQYVDARQADGEQVGREQQEAAGPGHNNKQQLQTTGILRNTPGRSGQIQLAIFDKYCMRSDNQSVDVRADGNTRGCGVGHNNGQL